MSLKRGCETCASFWCIDGRRDAFCSVIWLLREPLQKLYLPKLCQRLAHGSSITPSAHKFTPGQKCFHEYLGLMGGLIERSYHTHTQVRTHARHTHTNTQHTRVVNWKLHNSSIFFICGALQKCIFLKECLFRPLSSSNEVQESEQKHVREYTYSKNRLFSSKRVRSLDGAFNLIVILLRTRYMFLTAQQHGEDKGQSKEYDSQNDTSSGASIHPPPSLSSAPISKLLANQQTIKWYQIAKFGSPLKRL